MSSHEPHAACNRASKSSRDWRCSKRDTALSLTSLLLLPMTAYFVEARPNHKPRLARVSAT